LSRLTFRIVKVASTPALQGVYDPWKEHHVH
jgi:hypothetical protein